MFLQTGTEDAEAVPATEVGSTDQLTLLIVEVLQPVPVEVRLDSMILVPATAAKLGTVVDQLLQLVPLLVEYRYSSAIVPVPPDPAETETVSICPAQTVTSVGFFVSPGATGCATTVIVPVAFTLPQPPVSGML